MNKKCLLLLLFIIIVIYYYLVLLLLLLLLILLWKTTYNDNRGKYWFAHMVSEWSTNVLDTMILNTPLIMLTVCSLTEETEKVHLEWKRAPPNEDRRSDVDHKVLC